MTNYIRATSFFDVGIHLQVETFGEYLDAVVPILDGQRVALEARLDLEARGLDGEASAQLYDHHSDRWHNLAVGFPARFFNSFLIAFCSWVESELDGLSRQHESANPSALRLDEVAGKGLRRSRLYLKRVVGVQFPDAGDWGKLLSIYRIRNQITHADGASAKLQPAEQALLRVYGCEGHDVVQQIALNEQFCRMALESARTFFADLEKALPETLKGW
jgi:hypothetical protein